MEFDRTVDASSANLPPVGAAFPEGAAATLADTTIPGGAGTLPGNFQVATGPVSFRTTARSVLPRVEADECGAPRLIHDAAERFVRQQSLGVGGMGEVEQALDRDIGRPVAIKRILPDAAGPAGVARFVTEVRVVGALEHPNVVPLHDVGIDEDGRYFFVMKYVEGKTLETLIEELAAGDMVALERWTFERRIELFIGVLRALAFAHSRGIIHRDVKPANIMLGRLGEVWLMDWGVAKVQATGVDLWDAANAGESLPEPISRAELRTTRHGTLVGTPAYMAPEQAAGHTVDARADLYAAAVVFHEFLSLHHYLEHRMGSLADLLAAVKTERPQFSHLGGSPGHQTHVPSELIHFCRRAMMKVPAERYASAEAMIDELHLILAGKIPVNCALTLTKRMTRETSRFVDRFPLLTLLLGGFFFLSFLGSLGTALALALLHGR